MWECENVKMLEWGIGEVNKNEINDKQSELNTIINDCRINHKRIVGEVWFRYI